MSAPIKSVKHYVQKLRKPIRGSSTELRQPGEEVKVGFGTGPTLVQGDGKKRKTWVCSIVLSFSRKAYSEAVSSEHGDLHRMSGECLPCVWRSGTDDQIWKTSRPPSSSLTGLTRNSIPSWGFHFPLSAGSFRTQGHFALMFQNELAGGCQRVNEIFDHQQTRPKRRPPLIVRSPPWKHKTSVGKAQAGLSHGTDIKKLSRLGTLWTQECARLHEERRITRKIQSGQWLNKN